MRRPTVWDMDEGGGETVSFDESVDRGWRLFGDKVTASMSEPEPQGHLIANFFGDSADQLMAGISWSRSEGDLIASVQLLPRDASLTEEQERALQGMGLGPTDAEGERHVVMDGDDPVGGAALVVAVLRDVLGVVDPALMMSPGLSLAPSAHREPKAATPPEPTVRSEEELMRRVVAALSTWLGQVPQVVQERDVLIYAGDVPLHIIAHDIHPGVDIETELMSGQAVLDMTEQEVRDCAQGHKRVHTSREGDRLIACVGVSLVRFDAAALERHVGYAAIIFPQLRRSVLTAMEDRSRS